jgi:hypothetical protein
VRDGLAPGDYRDPGWYAHPAGTQPRVVSTDPDWGTPARRETIAPMLPTLDAKSAASPHGAHGKRRRT